MKAAAAAAAAAAEAEAAENAATLNAAKGGQLKVLAETDKNGPIKQAAAKEQAPERAEQEQAETNA
jgi:hypothetical protein